ncbi:MAG TPA: hypothetical protein PLP42_22505, partial [Acidobacteriota bacterium]|nr:hypothetical protein [Acidobacteriota bacterium]
PSRAPFVRYKRASSEIYEAFFKIFYKGTLTKEFKEILRGRWLKSLKEILRGRWLKSLMDKIQ